MKKGKLQELKLDRRRLPIVAFFWDDAVSNANWFNVDKAKWWIKDDDQMQMFDVGVLLSQSKRHIVIAQRMNLENDYTEAMFGTLHKIPKPWIRHMQILGYIDVKTRQLVTNQRRNRMPKKEKQ